MTSIVGICNLALSNIRKSSISDLNEASEEARQCKIHYEISRDTLLQLYPWEFAGTVQSLAPVDNDWTSRWAYAYKRPNTCLKIRRVVPEVDYPNDIDPPTHGLRGSTVYTSYDPAFIEFTRREENPTLFPPLFVDALAWALASRLAVPLTADRSLRADAVQMASAARAAAEAADANDQPDRPDYEASWIAAR
jgi:hypothetical protein